VQLTALAETKADDKSWTRLPAALAKKCLPISQGTQPLASSQLHNLPDRANKAAYALPPLMRAG